MADRNRRRCVMRKTALPDATHYVGYVEDDETPEMIMKKFEEMERIKAASKRSAAHDVNVQHDTSAGPSSKAAAAATGSEDEQQPDPCAMEEDGPLDQQQLQEIFKATSMYNVKSLLGNNEALMVDASQRLQGDRGAASDMGLDSDSGDDLVAELRGFWSDEDWSKPNKKKDRGTKRVRGDGSRRAASRSMQRNARTCIITQYNRDTHAFIRRRVRVADPDAILQLRLPPPPLPLSWGKAVKPYRPRVVQQVLQLQGSSHVGTTGTGVPASSPDTTAAVECAAGSSKPGGASTGATSAVPAAAGVVVPRGLITQPPALPSARNCDPQVLSHGGGQIGSSSHDAAAPGSTESPGCQVHLTPDLTAFDFKQLPVQAYQAVLINTGWEATHAQQQQQQQQEQQQQRGPGQAPNQNQGIHDPKQQEDGVGHQQVSGSGHPPQLQEQAGPGPSSLAAAAAAAAAAAGSAGVPSWGTGSSAHAWHTSSRSATGSSVVSRLEMLPIPQLCPRGFIMIWANKEHLSAVFRLMSRWGFSYVENLTWVLLAPNHSILQLPSACVQRSHITLYIFRKDGEGRDIELRHQRNPDVVFDYVRAVEGREWDVPAEVFDSIETLLPTGKGLFLELWAPTQAGRAGWTHLVEQPAGHGMCDGGQ